MVRVSYRPSNGAIVVTYPIGDGERAVYLYDDEPEQLAAALAEAIKAKQADR